MTHRHLPCATCGAPLEAPWEELVIVCRACGTHNTPAGVAVPAFVPADGRPRVNVGGRTWVIEGRLAQGDSSAVYRARWASRLGEAAALKIEAASGDGDLLRHEFEVLRGLTRSGQPGAAHFLTRLPAPVALGVVHTDRPRVAAVYGWRSGFVHTLTEVGEAHPTGVPGEVVVWLLKRLLELLAFVHADGVVHGAVTPDHVLVHPRDHGATLVGWTVAGPPGGAPPARPRRWLSLYEGLPAGRSPALDVAMACRVVEAASGWHLPGAGPPAPLVDVLRRGASGRCADARALADQLTDVSRRVHGPPAWHPLPMPGWAPPGRAG